MGMFLEREELVTLTGRKSKSLQIATLRKMGIVFYVNAIGHPVVARAAVEGKADASPPTPAWSPRVLS